MNRNGNVLQTMQDLVALFSPVCADKSTLNELSMMLRLPRQSWSNSRQLFQRIRQKTLGAERENDTLLYSQYLFEESCAKTLYNLSGSDGPYDTASPYWIIPCAFALARRTGIDDAQIVGTIAAF